VVAEGAPVEIAAAAESHTGYYLGPVLAQGRKYAAAPARPTNAKAKAAALAASLPSGENTKAGKARAKAKARAEAKAKAAR
jgi:hypothetical protein